MKYILIVLSLILVVYETERIIKLKDLNIKFLVPRILIILYFSLYYGVRGFGENFSIMMLSIPIYIYITFTDLKYELILDQHVLMITILNLSYSLFNNQLKKGVIGCLTAFFLFLFFAVISKGGVGGGDIKLLSAIGIGIRYPGVILTILLSSLMFSIVGLFLLLFKKVKGLPFGPFITISMLAYCFFII
ncbi:prepilin peptidase [Tissierella sp.]|uniref:prepilin peptidase n=1 Tax=Tissierella sp. TaxID=41274 RepID=UPI003061AE30